MNLDNFLADLLAPETNADLHEWQILAVVKELQLLE